MNKRIKYQRVALFIDYENFYNTLQKRNKSHAQKFGTPPKIDFHALVNFINKKYGCLEKADFIAVANFTHYDSQKGGLNQVASLINIDSFESRADREPESQIEGKKHVIKDYADIRLAFEIGKHAFTQPAELYIIASNDKSFAAIGRALEQSGYPVIFLLPDPQTTAMIIKENFGFIHFDQTQPKPAPQKDIKIAEEQPKSNKKPDHITQLCDALKTLREEFSTAIPLVLIQAIFGPTLSKSLIQKAEGQGKIDLWQAPNSSITCISRREERLFGNVHPIDTRPEFVKRAEILHQVSLIAEDDTFDPKRAEWRRALKNNTDLSTKETKLLFNALFDLKILQDGKLDKPNINLNTAILFLQLKEI